MNAQLERTVFGVLYTLLASKKTQTWIAGFILTGVTWLLTFLAMHLAAKWQVLGSIQGLIPMVAGVLSTAIISGMLTTLHALGKQDQGKEAAALTGQNLKDAFGEGLHDFIVHVEGEAPGLLARFLEQNPDANLPPAIKLAGALVQAQARRNTPVLPIPLPGTGPPGSA